MTDPGKLGFELIMRDGMHPSKVVGRKVPPPPDYVEVRENGLLIQRNVQVRMRDGVRIYVDIYRPDGAAGEHDLPILLGWSPYGKHNTSTQLAWPAADVALGWMSPYTAFEAPDPGFWCAHGYAVVYPDPRGSWYSEGELRHGGVLEAQDCYDLIEWLGVQPWTNGKVGMSGVSYLAAIQWQVAPLRPPHLAAINPWEGFSDWYREFATHGGIPETRFVVRGSGNLQWSTTRTEDTPANARAHPLYDEYWASKESDLESIQTPAYVVASWADQGLHTRGTIEGYNRIASQPKWLEVHGRKKWYYYYEPSSVAKQLAFFNRFLKDAGDDAFKQAPVLIEVRERANVGEFRAEHEWPLARTQFRKLYVDAARGALSDDAAPAASEVRYDARAGQAVFDYAFKQDTELTGSMSLRLWVEAAGCDDMDLFVGLQKFDAGGNYVPFVYYAMLVNGPVALGWLRVSHRELDPVRSKPERPFHPHTSEWRLQPGERVAADIEIWASSTSFQAGEKLRLIVQGRDLEHETLPNSPYMGHEDTRNQGTHVIHAGGKFDSYLLVPVIPKQ